LSGCFVFAVVGFAWTDFVTSFCSGGFAPWAAASPGCAVAAAPCAGCCVCVAGGVWVAGGVCVAGGVWVVGGVCVAGGV
jgi:hypothetical protein